MGAFSTVSKAKLVYIVSTAAANDDDVTECLAAVRPGNLKALQAACSSAVLTTQTLQCTTIDQKWAEAVNFEAVQSVSEALLHQLDAAARVLEGTGVMELVQGSQWQAVEPDERVTFMRELLAADPEQFWDMMVADVKTITYIAHEAAKLSTANTSDVADLVRQSKQDSPGISKSFAPQVQALGQI